MSVVAGRSRVATKYGIVAASQPLAARAGVQMLERGGNAVDAAIATNAVMGLVEPQIERHRRRSVRDRLRSEDRQAARPERRRLGADRADAGAAAVARHRRGCRGAGIHTVTVPGAVAGWDALRARFGTLPMADLLAPAIFYADDGFPVSRRDRRRTGRRSPTKLAAEPNAAKTSICPTAARRAPARSSGIPISPRSLRLHRRARTPPASTKARPPTRSSRSRARRAAR